MFNALTRILASGDYTIVEDFELPSKEPRYRKVPKYLFDSKVGSFVQKNVTNKGGLWHHQSFALEKIGQGENVVIATGTASGKSLVFRAEAFHRVLTNPAAKVLVFYPLKALAADQMIGWQDDAAMLGLPEGFIGRIDGTVTMDRREGILAKSRVLIMTPDVCHAWMMSNVANLTIKHFLQNLALIILDEAHTLEGVFGSNFAFLFRRILAARNSLLTAQGRSKLIAVIAATATIADAAEHLLRLTGLDFTSVGEREDGSPHYKRRCVHVAASPDNEMNLAKSIQVSLLSKSDAGGFITFVDSRKAVELLAVASRTQLQELLVSEEVMPYRAGLHSEDRKSIEMQLKQGSLRGVVSTSALELGIDLPHLQVGINIGVPATRKAYRQRLGRVGRGSPGLFVIVAEHNAFTRYGTTFREYHDMSVEPSYLYLENRFMQYAHARCLFDELESVGAKDKSALPTRIGWPQGFEHVFKAARPGGDRPKEFDGIAQLGGDLPQRGYPLRNVGEINFKIGLGEHAESIGEATLAQALRECYPGATYYHMAKPYRVLTWVTNAFEPYIKVKPLPPVPSTKPRIRTWINAGLTEGELVDGHLRKGENGFIAECQMQITERVEGFYEGTSGSFKSYQELREKNPNLRPRMRQFRTTGVIIAIEEEWFRDAGHRELVVERLREIFCREHSTLPQDVGSVATNISITTTEGHKARSDCIAIFDQTYGSLRLTEKVYEKFGRLLERFYVAAESETGTEKEFYMSVVRRLQVFEQSLQNASTLGALPMPEGLEGSGLLNVFGPGSRVGLREKGILFTDVEILMPTIMPDGKLMYQVKCPPKHAASPPTKHWVNPEHLEPSAADGEWEYALWDPVTQEYVEDAD